jgi:myosin-crossreactive antigen
MNKKLVEEAPYHPGYEDAGFEPKKLKELTDEEINTEMLAYLNSKTMGLEDFARAILRKAQEK